MLLLFFSNIVQLLIKSLRCWIHCSGTAGAGGLSSVAEELPRTSVCPLFTPPPSDRRTKYTSPFLN